MADEKKTEESTVSVEASKKETPTEVQKEKAVPVKSDSGDAETLTEKDAGTASKTETPNKKKTEVKIPKEFKALIETIEKLSVLELHQLVKVMEERFDVSAQAVAVAATGADGDDATEEKDSFIVELKDVGAQKIAVIKAIKALLGLGLKEAKDLVDGAPSVMKEGVKKKEAEAMKVVIEEAGGTVELK